MLLPLSQLPLVVGVAVAVAAVAVVRGSSKILKKTVARSVRFVRSTRAVHVNG